MRISAIGFDIDGTLYPARELYMSMLPAALKNLRLLRAFNAVRKDLRNDEVLARYGIETPTTLEIFHKKQAEMTAERLNVRAESIQYQIDSFFYKKSEQHFSHIKLYPHAVELLTILRSRGLRLGALSDFPAERKLELMKISDKFDVIMTSEETGRVKPHRHSFDILVERLGIPANEILYVGNSEAYDIVGAKAAGMHAALISGKKQPDSKADFVFKTFFELEKYILSHL